MKLRDKFPGSMRSDIQKIPGCLFLLLSTVLGILTTPRVSWSRINALTTTCSAPTLVPSDNWKQWKVLELLPSKSFLCSIKAAVPRHLEQSPEPAPDNNDIKKRTYKKTRHPRLASGIGMEQEERNLTLGNKLSLLGVQHMFDASNRKTRPRSWQTLIKHAATHSCGLQTELIFEWPLQTRKAEQPIFGQHCCIKVPPQSTACCSKNQTCPGAHISPQAASLSLSIQVIKA